MIKLRIITEHYTKYCKKFLKNRIANCANILKDRQFNGFFRPTIIDSHYDESPVDEHGVGEMQCYTDAHCLLELHVTHLGNDGLAVAENIAKYRKFIGQKTLKCTRRVYKHSLYSLLSFTVPFLYAPHGVKFITVRNEVAKVMFLQASVCPRGGGCLPECMLGYHTPLGADTPPEQALLRMVRILLECILVSLATPFQLKSISLCNSLIYFSQVLKRSAHE